MMFGKVLRSAFAFLGLSSSQCGQQIAGGDALYVDIYLAPA
jgi:hypothetical protein